MKISPSSVFIIAEVGVNHNGRTDLAKRMIDVAQEAGADAVKFQAWKAERLVTRFAAKAQYQKSATPPEESQLEMLRPLELSEDDLRELLVYSKQKGIKFLCSPFDLESISMLDELGLDIFKVPSGEITNLPYLQKLGGLRKKLILSTGMATLEEIQEALDVVVTAGTPLANITVLHCNTEYPTPYEDVNLLAMQTIARELGIEVGYSDHTLGLEVSVAAVALGAKVIEKHFTLDRNMTGPDHQASLEPTELKEMVSAIRNIELVLGDGVKRPSVSESKNIPIARKSIVAARAIKQGDLLSETNLYVKRPGNGISPMRWAEVVGTRAIRDFAPDELIKLE